MIAWNPCSNPLVPAKAGTQTGIATAQGVPGILKKLKDKVRTFIVAIEVPKRSRSEATV